MQKIVPKNAVLIPETATCVFEGIVFDVYHWPQTLYDGSTKTFEMLRRDDTVTAVCVVDGKIVVLQDEQPHRGLRISFPGGSANKDEDALTAIKREVHEETGYRFKNWRLVNVFQSSNKIERFTYMYIAWEVESAGSPRPDAGERISVELLPFADVQQLVLDNVGHLGSWQDMFESGNLEHLLAVPEFVGKMVER